jgi:polysaccharide export outer membrane protein
MRSWTRQARRIGVLTGLLVVNACAGVNGPYVWVDEYAPTRKGPADYAIGVGDLLNIQVWDHDKISTRERVRSDGRISIPLLGDVEATGKAPRQLGIELERRLGDANLVVNPRVNVMVDEVRPISVAILGAVSRPGTYSLEPGAGVAIALASAGGLTDFAHADRVFVVRRVPTPVRIRFTFEAITGGVGEAPVFKLQSGDLVVVE